MKDITGREIHKGDLVASKPSGRNATMRVGLSLGGKRIVFRSGTTGGASDQVIIRTEGDPVLEYFKQELIDDIAAIREKSRADKAKKDKDKLKKSQIKRFSSYVSHDTYKNHQGRLYLGDCIFEGKVFKNAWVRLVKEDFNEPESATNLAFNRKYRHRNRQRVPDITEIKLPTVHKVKWRVDEGLVQTLCKNEGITLL